MLAGYSYVERLVADKVDIFAMGEHRHMLELNRIVLCGTDADRRREYAGHLAATERRFYEERNAGIEDSSSGTGSTRNARCGTARQAYIFAS